MIRILTKIWIALIPLLVYIFWVYVIENIILRKLLQPKNSKEKIIDGQFKVVGEKSTQEGTNNTTQKQSENSEPAERVGNFSLHNKRFVIALYIGLIAMITSLLMSAFE